MAYSQDLRERVIAAVQAGGQTLSQIAATFRISEATLDLWCQRWRETGSVAAKPWAGGRPRTLATSGARIRAAVKQQPDLTLQELCDHIAEKSAGVASPSMMARELQILKLSRKKSRSTTVSGRPRG
jgi:putative transposase